MAAVENKCLLLMSIKPKYVEKILLGEKRYEFRKQFDKRKCDLMLIYSSYPVMKIVAMAEITNRITELKVILWPTVQNQAGITFDEYRAYFSGGSIARAYELGKVTVFKEPLALAEVGVKTAPQSFCYVPKSQEIINLIKCKI